MLSIFMNYSHAYQPQLYFFNFFFLKKNSWLTATTYCFNRFLINIYIIKVSN